MCGHLCMWNIIPRAAHGIELQNRHTFVAGQLPFGACKVKQDSILEPYAVSSVAAKCTGNIPLHSPGTSHLGTPKSFSGSLLSKTDSFVCIPFFNCVSLHLSTEMHLCLLLSRLKIIQISLNQWPCLLHYLPPLSFIYHLQTLSFLILYFFQVMLNIVGQGTIHVGAH